MSKGGFMTPKALANRMKSKGLQRLRWYCQMCAKQCRDENGFKCHCQSEAHLQQMALFADNAQSFVDRFSQQFVDGYLAELQRKGGRRVKANHVYTAYIADKAHVHMNATKWDSLSSFVSYLGKQRLAEVSQDEEGEWWISYIDRDPRVIARQEAAARKEARERSAEEEERRRIDAEVEEARKRKGEETEPAVTAETEEERARREEEEAARLRHWRAEGEGAKVTLALPPPPQSTRGAPREPRANPLLFLRSVDGRGAERQGAEKVGEKRRPSALEAIVEEEERRRARQQRPPSAALPPLSTPTASAAAAALRTAPPPSFPSSSSWLCPSLVVRVLSRSLHGGALFRQKGRVLSVDDDGRSATVALLSPPPFASPSSSPSAPPVPPPVVVQVERRELETVIPALGQPVLVVRGERKGRLATLTALSDDQFTCSLRMLDDLSSVDGVQLESVCKTLPPP